MIYIKSFFFGILTMFLSTVLFVVGTVWWFSRNIERPPGTAVGWDIRVFTQWPLFWLIVFLGFVAGFYWEFRRTSR